MLNVDTEDNNLDQTNLQWHQQTNPLKIHKIVKQTANLQHSDVFAALEFFAASWKQRGIADVINVGHCEAVNSPSGLRRLPLSHMTEVIMTSDLKLVVNHLRRNWHVDNAGYGIAQWKLTYCSRITRWDFTLMSLCAGIKEKPPQKALEVNVCQLGSKENRDLNRFTLIVIDF